jgi:putative phosphoesterase
MKIAIISDTHDNLANIKKTLDFLKREKIKFIIHCGDVAAPATLNEILKNFSGKIHLVFGNVDGDQFRMTKLEDKYPDRLKIWGEIGKLKIASRKIAFTHFPEFAKALFESKKYDLVFYGHTHKPWKEEKGKIKLINPGNLAGMFYRATFAIYDTKTDKIELRDVN